MFLGKAIARVLAIFVEPEEDNFSIRGLEINGKVNRASSRCPAHPN